jgi:hypothetical protein
MKEFKWEQVTSTTMPNLFVLKRNGVEVGFIQKPKDTKTDKNAWRLYKGIGPLNTFLVHEYNKKLAMSQVEKEVSRA